MQRPLRLGVDREPVFAVNLLAIGDEGRGKVLVALPFDVRHILPVCHHNLVVPLVHPDAPLEVPLALFHHLGRNIKNVGLQCIHALPAHVGDVVLANLLLCQHKRQSVLNVAKVRRSHHDALQRVARRIDGLFHLVPVRGKDDVVHLQKLAVWLAVVVQGVHLDRALVGVIVQRALEGAFFGGKLVDDLLRRGPYRLRRVQWAKARIKRHGRSAALRPRRQGQQQQNAHDNRGQLRQTQMLQAPHRTPASFPRADGPVQTAPGRSVPIQEHRRCSLSTRMPCRGKFLQVGRCSAPWPRSTIQTKGPSTIHDIPFRTRAQAQAAA
jgi:hypothetical protein